MMSDIEPAAESCNRITKDVPHVFFIGSSDTMAQAELMRHANGGAAGDKEGVPHGFNFLVPKNSKPRLNFR
jgi:hypothetical protein